MSILPSPLSILGRFFYGQKTSTAKPKALKDMTMDEFFHDCDERVKARQKREITADAFLSRALPYAAALKIASEAMQADDESVSTAVNLQIQIEAASKAIAQLKTLSDAHVIVQQASRGTISL